jgi:hypothetical protein
MAYKGSDLGEDFKSFYRKEKSRITKYLKSIGCTNIQFDYGFYFFSGFFTTNTGQMYYLSCSDVRDFPNDKYLYRTVKHYKDYTGGCNNYVTPSKLNEMSLQ